MDRQVDRERERLRERDSDRKRDRPTNKQTDRHRYENEEIEIDSERQTFIQIYYLESIVNLSPTLDFFSVSSNREIRGCKTVIKNLFTFH